MLQQYTKIIVVNNSGNSNVFDNGGTILLRFSGVYVVPSTGLLAYDAFIEDAMQFDAGRSIADGGEVYDDASLCHSADYDNTSNKYINALVQLEVKHSGATGATGSWDIYKAGSDAANTMETDNAAYIDAESNKLAFVGSLFWPAGLTDDDIVTSPAFLI